jgi:hypothetical protein
MMVRLGAVSVAVVDNPNKCPAGTYPSTIAVATGASAPLYECLSGEPWYCEWFGIGCKGVPAVAPAAPQTEQQMRDPEQWTPETSVDATKQTQDAVTAQWLANTEGVAQFPAWLSETGNDVKDALTAPSLWFVVGAAAVVAVIILAKRV